MAEVTVVWDDAAVKLFCEAPSGPVAQAMSGMADRVLIAMKALCPVSPHDTPASARWPARRSGTLRSSIQKFRLPDGSYLVGPTATTEGGQLLGPMIEHGTPPHDIDAKGPWSLHNAATGQYFGPHVRHPGTRPHPFIAPAAAAINGVTVHI